MFLTKESILKDQEFLEKLSKTIFQRFGINGLDTIVSNLNKYAPDNSILPSLFGKFFQDEIINELFNTYVFQFISKLENSPEKPIILEKISSILEEYRVEAKKKSDQPWVEIVGEYYDEDQKRMKISFDWNDAFIRLLKQKGYPGENEDDLVQMWLQEIANQR